MQKYATKYVKNMLKIQKIFKKYAKNMQKSRIFKNMHEI